MKQWLGKIMRFTKVEHTVFSLPLIFAGAWLGAGRQLPGWTDLGLLVLAGVGARILGMAMNRYLDRLIDAQNPRTKNRELPSGQLSPRSALAVAAVGFILYEIACYLLDPFLVLLSWIPAVALIGYSLLKRFTSLCHYGIGFCLALAPLGAYIAVRGSLAIGADVLWLAAFTFAWMSGFDIIYGILDINFDRSHGIKSIPARLGQRGALWVAGITHLVALLALVFVLRETNGGLLAGAALVVSMGAFIAAYIPRIPLPMRFFPISAVAGIAGAVTPFLGGTL